MEIIESSTFVSDRAWGSRLLLEMPDHTVKIHWTDQPYRWHQNTGEELFVVLDGEVEMTYLEEGEEHMRVLAAGQMALIGNGEHHVARPRGEARILVVEKKGTD